MTLLQTRPDGPLPRAVADLGSGTGPQWLDAWLGEHAGDVVGWRRAIHAHPELARSEHATTALCARVLESAGLSPASAARHRPDLRHRDRARARSRCAPTWTPCRCTSTPTRPGPRRTPASRTCAGTTRTPPCCSAPGSRSPRWPTGCPAACGWCSSPPRRSSPAARSTSSRRTASTDVDRIFALHCDPRLEVGHVGTRVGPITSACDMLELRLTSPGGHTSRPHLTADLVHALGTVITGPARPALAPGRPALGHRPRLGPGRRRARGERRPGARDALRARCAPPSTRRGTSSSRWCASSITALLAPTGVGYVLEHRRGVPPVVNDPVSADLLARAAERAAGPGCGRGHRAVLGRRGLRLVPRARAGRHGPTRRVVGRGPAVRHPPADVRSSTSGRCRWACGRWCRRRCSRWRARGTGSGQSGRQGRPGKTRVADTERPEIVVDHPPDTRVPDDWCRART